MGRVPDYYDFNVIPYQKIKVEVWVPLVLGCDLYMGEYGGPIVYNERIFAP